MAEYYGMSDQNQGSYRGSGGGGFLGKAGSALGSPLGLSALQFFGSQLLGSPTETTTTNETSRQGFDQSQLPFMMKALGLSDAQAAKFRQQLAAQSGQQMSSAMQGFDQERAAMEGLFSESFRRNAATTAARRNRAMGGSLMAQNSTVGRGMAALEGREGARRDRGIAAQEQAGYAGLFGRQNAARMGINQTLGSQLFAAGGQQQQMHGLLAQAASQARKTNIKRTSTSESKGWLG